MPANDTRYHVTSTTTRMIAPTISPRRDISTTPPARIVRSSERVDQPVQHLDPTPVARDLVAHCVAGRLRPVAVGVPTGATLELRQLRRAGREQRPSQRPQLLLRLDRQLEVKHARLAHPAACSWSADNRATTACVRPHERD